MHHNMFTFHVWALPVFGMRADQPTGCEITVTTIGNVKHQSMGSSSLIGKRFSCTIICLHSMYGLCRFLACVLTNPLVVKLQLPQLVKCREMQHTSSG